MNRELYDWRKDPPEGRQRIRKLLRSLGKLITFAALCVVLGVLVALQAGGAI